MIFVQVLSGLLTPMIALVALYIAWQQRKIADEQKKIASDKLKFDLFERRFKVYKIVNDYMLQISKETSQPHSEDGRLLNFGNHVDFNLNTKEAPFLFDDDIIEYLEGVRKQSVALINAYNALKDRANFPMYSPVRNDYAERHRNASDWFKAEIKILERHFEKYLGFKHLK